MDKLDILLINPGNKGQMYGKLGNSLAACEPPLWTALLASVLREKGFTVKIIDAEAQNWSVEYTVEKIIEEQPLLTGVSAIGANPSASSTPKMPVISYLLNLLKEKSPDTTTFLYGIHPSALPAKTLREEVADYICRGECFHAVPALLDALKSGERYPTIPGIWYEKDGRIAANGWGTLVDNINDLPFAAWDLLPMPLYRAHNWHCFQHINQRQPYAVMYTSLGCPYHCTYCNIHTLYDGKPRIRYRSMQKVVDEIGLLVEQYQVKNIKLLDELFVLRQDRANEFCDLILERNYDLNIWAYARVDTVNDTILRKLKRAGVNWLCYGIESGSKIVRDGVHKGKFKQDVIKEAIRKTKEAGIYIIGNYMFGLPDDTLETMQETLDLAKELNCEYANFYATMAYPGSQLYEECAAAGGKLPESWLGYSQFNPEAEPLPTQYLSSEEVLAFRDQAFDDYFSDSNYLKMIEKMFGREVVDHIKKMLKHKLKRKLFNNMNYEEYQNRKALSRIQELVSVLIL